MAPPEEELGWVATPTTANDGDSQSDLRLEDAVVASPTRTESPPAEEEPPTPTSSSNTSSSSSSTTMSIVQPFDTMQVNFAAVFVETQDPHQLSSQPQQGAVDSTMDPSRNIHHPLSSATTISMPQAAVFEVNFEEAFAEPRNLHHSTSSQQEPQHPDDFDSMFPPDISDEDDVPTANSSVKMILFCVLSPLLFVGMVFMLFYFVPGILVIFIFMMCYIHICGIGPEQQATNVPERSRQEMEAMLITRRVISIEDHYQTDDHGDNARDANRHEDDEQFPDPSTHRKHSGKVQLTCNSGQRRLILSDIVIPGASGELDDRHGDEEEQHEFATNHGIVSAYDRSNKASITESQDIQTQPSFSAPLHDVATQESDEKFWTNDDYPTDNQSPSSPQPSLQIQPAPEGPCCDICLGEYQRDDLVCWSSNPACIHAFHQKCVLDWLERKPNCPSCRRPYIVEPTTEGVNIDDNNV